MKLEPWICNCEPLKLAVIESASSSELMLSKRSTLMRSIFNLRVNTWLISEFGLFFVTECVFLSNCGILKVTFLQMTESKLPSRNRQRFQFTETSDNEISTSPSFIDNFFELNPVDNLSSKELICTGPILNDLIIRWFESSQYRKPINNPKAKNSDIEPPNFVATMPHQRPKPGGVHAGADNAEENFMNLQ